MMLRSLLAMTASFSTCWHVAAQTFDFTFTPGYGVTIAERIVDGQLVVVSGQIQSVSGSVLNPVGYINWGSNSIGTISGLMSPNSFYSGYPPVYGLPLSILNDNTYNLSSPFLTSYGFAFTAGSGNVPYNISALSGSPQQYALYASGGGVVPGEMTFTRVSGSSGASPVCFLKGTFLSAAHEYVLIDNLKVGDVVRTITDLCKVRWIGQMAFYRRQDGTFRDDVYPVRISAGAFGANQPERDLLLSQAHSVFVDGLLIPIGSLVNGKSILIDRSIDEDSIVYYHIELDNHTAVFAEGLACESLQASEACRKRFDNYDEYLSLYFDEARPDLAAFAPFGGYNGGQSELKCILRAIVSKVWDVRNGYQRVRDQIDERAGITRLISVRLFELLRRLAKERIVPIKEATTGFVRLLNNFSSITRLNPLSRLNH